MHVDDCEQADDGSLFIAMDYIEGVTLRQLLRAASGPLPTARALAIARGVADALASADALGMVHRDIKPENILLARDRFGRDVPKVTDFGIAAMRESAVVSSTRPLLTPAYASPEQWRGMKSNELDGRADLYALGVTLYEMLAGCLPFHAHTDEAWMRAHLDEQPVPPSHYNPSLAQYPGLDTLVLVLLSKDRDDRPQSGLVLLQELNLIEAQSTWDQPTVLARSPRPEPKGRSAEPLTPPPSFTPAPAPAPSASVPTPAAPNAVTPPTQPTPIPEAPPAPPLAPTVPPAAPGTPAVSSYATPHPQPAPTQSTPAFGGTPRPQKAPEPAPPLSPSVSPSIPKPSSVPPRLNVPVPPRPKPASPSVFVPPVQHRSQRNLMPILLAAAALVILISALAFLRPWRKSSYSSSTLPQSKTQPPSADSGQTSQPAAGEPGGTTAAVVPPDSNSGPSSSGHPPSGSKGKDRYAILQDTQSKIAEIQKDVSTNRAATQEKAYKKWDEYINSGSSGSKSPSAAQASVSAAPATGKVGYADCRSVVFSLAVYSAPASLTKTDEVACGDSFQVLGREGGFYRVLTKRNVTGYVAADLVSSSQPIGSATSSKATPSLRQSPSLSQNGPIRVGGNVQATRIVNRVQPVYPELARQSRISGTVRLHAIIGKDGSVEQLEIIDGHPLLQKAALDAVREWRYQPTVVNGKAVQVDTTIEVVFSLRP